jgi:STAS domain
MEVPFNSGSNITVRPAGYFGDSVVRSLPAIGPALTYGIDVDVDLRHVRFIDADAVSALAGLVHRVRASGGQARLFNVRSSVRWRLELAGLGGPRSSSRGAVRQAGSGLVDSLAVA